MTHRNSAGTLNITNGTGTGNFTVDSSTGTANVAFGASTLNNNTIYNSSIGSLSGISTSGYVSTTTTSPNVGWGQTTVSGNGISTGNTFYTPHFTYPKPVLNIDTAEDDEGKQVLQIRLGEKKDCNFKVHLFPGIQLYSNHKKPNFFRRMILNFLFGIKWESTEMENFCEQL